MYKLGVIFTEELTLEEAKKEFELFEMSIMFMDIENTIDCTGITFDEWIKNRKIKIKTK